MKSRLDHLLVARELVESGAKAKALILAGKVLVDDELVDKAGTLVSQDAQIRIKGSLKYVSRGGLKLEKAILEFAIPVKAAVCLDVGASTGGFTDCLLQNGAAKVYAVDVGYGQMHWKLQSDTRVFRFDRENFRYFDVRKIAEEIDICVIDASFISLKLLIPKVIEIFQSRKRTKKSHLIALIKPQFEVGKKKLAKGGIVKDELLRQNVVTGITKFAQEAGFTNVRTIESPVTGSDGNVEYLMWAEYSTFRINSN